MVSRAVEPSEVPFPHVAQVARIDRRRELRNGKVEEETVYVLSSRTIEQLDAKSLAKALRAHWGIENSLHYRRDRTYDEDRHQVKKRGTAQVMASLRNLAIALRKHIAPSCKRHRDRTLPQMHRRFASKPHLAIPFLTKPWD